MDITVSTLYESGQGNPGRSTVAPWLQRLVQLGIQSFRASPESPDQLEQDECVQVYLLNLSGWLQLVWSQKQCTVT